MSLKGKKNTINLPGKKQVHEDLYRSLFENVHDGIYQSTVDGKILTANPALVKMLGYKSEEELKRMNIGRDIYVRSAERDALAKQLEKKGRLNDVELVLKKKDGSHIIVLENSHVIRGEKGDILYYEGTLTEITARKEAEEQLMFLKHSIDVHYDGAYWMDPESRFVYVNDAGCKASGYKREELIGKHVSFLNPKAPEKVMKLVWDKLRKDGSFTTEITERKEVEDELRKSESRFRRLFESHSAVKLIIDPETGSIVDANNAAAEYYGRSVAKLRKMNLFEISTNTPEEIRSRFEKTTRNKGIFFETSNRLADGSLRDVEVFTSRIEIDNNYYLHSIVHDITEKKKMLADLIAAKEKAEESDRLKTAFLHNISHEIRTPMNAIVGFTSLLEIAELSEETRRQYIDIIFQSSNQLLSIISDIVDISNIETGHTNIALNKVNINTLIRSIYDQFHLRAEQQHLTFNLHPALSDSNAEIMADETKLIQVLSNLINNSFKFTYEGSVEFGYSVKGESIEFFVKDTGLGIEPDKYQKIFECFYQVENPVNHKTEGTGLGLSICKAYVELMGERYGLNQCREKDHAFILQYLSTQVENNRLTGTNT